MLETIYLFIIPLIILSEGCWKCWNRGRPLWATMRRRASKCLLSVVSEYGTHNAKVRKSNMAWKSKDNNKNHNKTKVFWPGNQNNTNKNQNKFSGLGIKTKIIRMKIFIFFYKGFESDLKD